MGEAGSNARKDKKPAARPQQTRHKSGKEEEKNFKDNKKKEMLYTWHRYLVSCAAMRWISKSSIL
jgi:hypothetical protein